MVKLIENSYNYSNLLDIVQVMVYFNPCDIVMVIYSYYYLNYYDIEKVHFRTNKLHYVNFVIANMDIVIFVFIVMIKDYVIYEVLD